MSALLAGALLPSALLAWAAAYLVRRKAADWGLVDQPGARKVHTIPTPLGGGLAIYLGVVVPLLAGLLGLRLVAEGVVPASALPTIAQTHLAGLVAQSGKLWIVLGAGTVLMVLGLVDDRRGLPWQVRIAVQTLVALVIIAQGWRLTAFVEVPWLTGALSVVWIVGLINSFNMLDNMDGLSAGVAAIAATMLAAVMLLAPLQPQLFIAGLLLTLVGALVGFLWHNHAPAKLFMGDAGSYFVGFLVAVTTLMATFAGENLPQHAILAPLCVLAVPIYDTLSVVAIRLRQGRSPFEGDKSHFSHRLVELGLSKTQAVWTIYLATATCGLGALLLHQVDTVGAAIVLTLVVCVLAIVAILETTGRKPR